MHGSAPLLKLSHEQIDLGSMTANDCPHANLDSVSTCHCKRCRGANERRALLAAETVSLAAEPGMPASRAATRR